MYSTGIQHRRTIAKSNSQIRKCKFLLYFLQKGSTENWDWEFRIHDSWRNRILIFYYIFHILLQYKNFFTLLFLFPWKFVESKCFLKQCSPIRDSSPQENYFSPLVIWGPLSTKVFEKARNKRKKYEKCFEEIVFLFKYRKRKIRL